MNPRRPLKILMLVSSYPRSEEDSASIFLRYLADNLSQRYINIHVLAPSDSKGETHIEDNVTIHRFQYFPTFLQQLAYGSGILPNLRHRPWLWIQVPFFLVSMAYSLLHIVRKERPDLIHVHWVLPQGMLAMLAKSFFKIPIIITTHGSDAFALRGRFMQLLKRLVLSKSDAWTANTQATAVAIGDATSLPKPHIIPMGVDVDRFSRGQRASLRHELPENELLILFVGRLVESKGIHDLLKAFSLISPEMHARTTLWIVGDGEYRPRLEQDAKALGIGDKTRFWGQVSNHLLPNFYAAADLFVLPSVEAAGGDSEGQGVVLLEAFAARACVVATRVGGITEVVEDGHRGVLVESRRPEQLAAAIEKLLNNEELRLQLAENAFDQVKRHYDWRKIAQDFEELYWNSI